MPDRPDFIVDSHGRAQDVRGRPGSRGPGAGEAIPTYVVRTAPQPDRADRGTPGVIFIPIGLILAMVVGIFRFIATRTGAEVYTDYEVSSARSGTWHYLEGEYDMAIAEFNIAIHSNPEFGDAYNGRGLVYLAMGRLDEALADFDRAIELLPESGDAYNNRGAAYYHEGDYTRAMADFDMAIQVEPGFAKAHYNRALVHNALGRYAEAIADFDRAIELTPETTFAALNEPPPGVSAAPIDELLDYFRLMESEADLPLAYANRGLAYLASGDFERAAADFSKALELGLDPDDQGWVEQGLEQVQSALSK